MGLYANPELLNWFTEEYDILRIKKLDMGKSYIRFKKIEEIPYGLVGELCKKMTPKDRISRYEQTVKP